MAFKSENLIHIAVRHKPNFVLFVKWPSQVVKPRRQGSWAIVLSLHYTWPNVSAQYATGRTRISASIAPLDWGIHPVPRGISQSSGAVDGHRGVHVHVYTAPEQPYRASVLRDLVDSVLDFGVAFQFAFSVKALFPGCTGSNPSQVTF